MGKNRIVLVLGLILLVVIAGAYVLYNQFAGDPGLGMVNGMQVTGASDNAATPETEEADISAPDFTFYDYSGNPRKLSEFEGKPVVLNFWASWCGPCKSEMPEFEEAYQTYGDQVQFLMMNLTDGYQETVESAWGYIATHGYTFPVFFDTDMEGSVAYRVTGVPVTYFIDEEGNLTAWASGAINGENLRQGIELICSPES